MSKFSMKSFNSGGEGGYFGVIESQVKNHPPTSETYGEHSGVKYRFLTTPHQLVFYITDRD